MGEVRAGLGASHGQERSLNTTREEEKINAKFKSPSLLPAADKSQSCNAAPGDEEVGMGILPTFLAIARNPDAPGSKKVIRVLVDGGAQISMCDVAIAQELKLHLKPSKTTVNPLGGGKSLSTGRQARLEICARSGLPKFSLCLSAIVLPKLAKNVFFPHFEPFKSYPELKSLKQVTAEDWPHSGPINIDVVLGQDYMAQIMSESVPQTTSAGKNGPTAFKSPFGLIIQGRVPSRTAAACFIGAATLEEKEREQKEVGKKNPLSVPRNRPPPAVKTREIPPLEKLLREMLDLEAVGIVEPKFEKQLTASEEYAVKFLEENMEYMEDSRRFRVKLPFDPKKPPLENNYQAALKRLNSLLASLAKLPTKKALYHDAMQKYLDKNHATKVTAADERATEIFHLPHSGVMKLTADGKTNKIRIVFDCSARDRNGNSLNETMVVGPVPDADLVRILTRFRMNKVAFGADVSECFLTVMMHPDDQNKFRFLWVNDKNEVVTYKFTSLIFGSKASPWISSTCLFKLLDKHLEKDKNLVEKVKKGIWVDDVLLSEPSADSAREIVQKLESIFSEASFKLAKFVSSDDAVLDHLSEDQLMFPRGTSKKGSLKVLGIDWQVDEDEIFIGRDLDSAFSSKKGYDTKRTVARMVASIYDPLGLVLPWKMGGNILIKNIWSYHDKLAAERGVSKTLKSLWDEKLPQDLQEKVNEWKTEYAKTAEIRLPRWVSLDCDAQNRTLYGFADASPQAFGCVVYMRTVFPNGNIQCRFLAARGKVNKVNGYTLPRCELLAAKFLATMIYNLKEFMDLPEDFPCKLFGDSMVALFWIKGNPDNWKTFVHNAVQVIRKFTDPEEWHHVPGLENPADLLTRPHSPSEILEHEPWLKGPAFAYTDELPPQPEFYPSSPEAAVEFKVKPDEILVAAATKELPEHPVDLLTQDISDVRKILRIIARFKRAAKARSLQGLFEPIIVTMGEMVKAADILMKRVQELAFPDEIKALAAGKPVSTKSKIRDLNPFWDGDLIRARGRVQEIRDNVSQNWLNPIIIENDGKIVPAVVRFIHEDKDHASTDTVHSLMRQRWWLLRSRRVISDIKKKCVICRKVTGPMQSQQQAPLPSQRLAIHQPPFTNVAIDGLGPLQIADGGKKGRKKVWVLVISCMTTRGINLELLEDQSAEMYVDAMRRHFADFGKAVSVRLDNFPSHKRMAEVFESLSTGHSGKLKKLSRRDKRYVEGIIWSWSAVGQPSTNGVVERAVRSVKESLMKAVGKATLDQRQLTTLLKEIRQIINSRPLIQLPRGSVDAELAITPNHLIYGHDLVRLPLAEEVVSDGRHKPALAYWSQKQGALKAFKKIFQEQYINSLVALKKKIKIENEPQVGDLVIVSHPNKKRSEWPIGVIEKLHPGLDGLARNVQVKIGNDYVNRSIRSMVVLRHLEEYDQKLAAEDEKEDVSDPVGEQLDSLPVVGEVEDEIC